MSGVGFAPVVPIALLIGLGVATILITAWALWRRARGAVWRAVAATALLLVLAGPVRILRQTVPRDNIVLVLLDHSASMAIGDRAAMVARAWHALRAHAPAHTRLRLVILHRGAGTKTDLFASLRRAVAAVPHAQRAGVVVLSDGEATDHWSGAKPHWRFPVSLLLPARRAQTDRELRLLATPHFGLVGHRVVVRFMVRDHGVADRGVAVPVRVSVDGRVVMRKMARVGMAEAVSIRVRHAGRSVVDVAAQPLPGAVSRLNDQAVFALHGIRRRLNVLLIAGAPNQGLRSWRLLLKSDPAVRLVNVTVLRDPNQALAAPERDMALIPFPARQLFSIDLHRFDLVIIDQFGLNGVLPDYALTNIASHVRAGGALLVETGPSYEGSESLALSPLGQILPVAPVPGGTIVGRFVPRLTRLGARDPVSALLAQHPGAAWYRFEQGQRRFGRTLLRAPGDAPLLVLGHVGRGRVAMLMSDQFWIWARGALGGDPALAGPAIPLLRRSVHWLLGAPDLAGNFLAAKIVGERLVIDRRKVTAGPARAVRITAPDGAVSMVPMTRIGPGRYHASVVANMPGVWRAQAGSLQAFAGAATGDAREYRDLAARASLLAPLVDRTGGRIIWLGRTAEPSWRGLSRDQQARKVIGVRRVRLLAAHAWSSVLIALVALGLVVLAWWRER